MAAAPSDQSGVFDTILEAWVYLATDADSTANSVWIPPDGCQDLIGIESPDGTTNWHIFSLATCAESVCLPHNGRVRGYRLRPGSQIQKDQLMAQVQRLAFDDQERVQTLLAELTCTDSRVSEALSALAQCSSTSRSAKLLGVSLRSLERLTMLHTGKTPGFWRALARVRQACRSLSTDFPLADLAADHGFCDQAHMNREFRKWLGSTPHGLRAHPKQLDLFWDSGYG